jgi:rubrerythrin
MKKYWRCIVCGDLHYGNGPANPCPTCGNKSEKAEEITKEEFLKALE